MPQRRERLGGRGGLHGDDQRAGTLEGRGLAQRGHRRGERHQTLDGESLPLEVLGALTARQHHDRVAGAGQVAADDGAHRTGAENGEVEVGHDRYSASAMSCMRPLSWGLVSGG